jgi:hypothetical protein
MTSWRLQIASILTLIIWCQGGAIGQAIHCNDADAARADYEASRLQSWDKLHQSYLLYFSCDEGSIGEGYSDSVVRPFGGGFMAL